MKPKRFAPDQKWCSGCSAVLPFASFGANKARPPLYLQSRCRSCTNASKGLKDAEKRKVAKAAKVSRELDAIAAEVSTAGVARYVHAPLIGACGFAMHPIAVLAIPRTRGRWPAKPEQVDELTASRNWCELLSDEACDEYREAGARIQWMRDRMGAGAPRTPLEFD